MTETNPQQPGPRRPFRILHYNPGQLTEEELADQPLLRQRQEVLDRIVRWLETARGDMPAAGPRAHLVVGPRGMGKTTLLLRTAMAVAQSPALAASWVPLIYPEEQYNVVSLFEFWLNSLDSLGDRLESAGQKDLSQELDAQVRRLEASRQPDEAAALACLLGWSDRLGRRLLLLVDNLQWLLDQLPVGDQARLGEALSQEERLCFVGGSLSAFSEDPEDPLYEAFVVHRLSGIDVQEAEALFRWLAERSGSERALAAAESLLERDPGRVRALHELAGGSPRTLLLLFQLLTGDDSALLGADGESGVLLDLERMLDQLTPYYKARVDDLAGQKRQVFHALALHWHPHTVRGIAEDTRLDVNRVSNQLDRMIRDGLVERIELPPDASQKRGTYQVAERFFNIWFLMRSSRRMRHRLRWLAEFLRQWYGEQALLERLDRMMRTCGPRNPRERRRWLEMVLAHSEAARTVNPAYSRAADMRGAEAISLASRSERKRLIASLDPEGEDRQLVRFYERLVAREEAAAALAGRGVADADALIESLWASPSRTLEEKHRAAGACGTADAGALRESLREEAEAMEAALGQERAERLSEALRLGYLTTGWDEESAPAAALLVGSPDLVATVEAAARVHGRDPRLAREQPGRFWLVVAREFGAQTRPRIDSKPGLSATGNVFRAIDLLQEKRYAEAEAAYRQALALDDRRADAWFGLGYVLQEHLARYAEAESAYRRAIELDSKYAVPWNNLGNLLKDHLGRYDEAESAYRRRIELDPKDALPWNNLGNLLQDHLGRYDEAESAYRRAIELDPKDARPWIGLGNLLQDHLGRYAEAECAYRRAIELDPKYALPWVGLGNLLKRHLARYTEAESAYRRAIELDPTYANPWNGLGWTLFQHGGSLSEAERSAREAERLSPAEGRTAHTLACILARAGDWPGAAERALRFLRNDPIARAPGLWADILLFFREAVESGHAREARELLDAAGRAEEWEALTHALEAIVTGSMDGIYGLAPELRKPAEEILERLVEGGAETVRGGRAGKRRGSPRRRTPR